MRRLSLLPGVEVVIDRWLGPWQMVYFGGKFRAGSMAIVDSVVYWANRRPWWHRLSEELA